jgi:hypothetical protein
MADEAPARPTLRRIVTRYLMERPAAALAVDAAVVMVLVYLVSHFLNIVRAKQYSAGAPYPRDLTVIQLALELTRIIESLNSIAYSFGMGLFIWACFRLVADRAGQRTGP